MPTTTFDAIDLLLSSGAFSIARPLPRRGNWNGRALSLFFRLNADMINYTPLSQRSRRASRIIVRLVSQMQVRA